MQWYMGLGEDKIPCGWSREPWGDAIEVPEETYDIAAANPDYLWDAERQQLVPPLAIQQVEHMPTYQELRAAEYPPMQDYVDAQVKIASDNLMLKTAGQQQLKTYIAASLAVKEKYPKVI